MNAVTLNTWGTYGPYQERWILLIEELMELDPDLICLQEVTECALIQKIKKSSRLRYFVFAQESALALFSKFPFHRESVIHYGTRSPNEQETRGAIIAEIDFPQGAITVANTHLSWRAEDEEVRLGQAHELIHLVKQVRHPSLLAGDFNASVESQTVREIKNAGLIDLYKHVHPKSKACTWDNQNSFIQTHSVKFPDRRIDFLFADKNFLTRYNLVDCDLVFNKPTASGLYASDHYGVLARFEF